MSDYKEQVNSLREHADLIETSIELYGPSATRLLVYDLRNAAAAIEALQAENPIVETVLVDKMRQQMEETACHCNVKDNAELIAKILDDDVDRKVFELPKHGEWELIDGAEPMRWGCSRCKYMSWETSNYCPRCGAEMEVQDV